MAGHLLSPAHSDSFLAQYPLGQCIGLSKGQPKYAGQVSLHKPSSQRFPFWHSDIYSSFFSHLSSLSAQRPEGHLYGVLVSKHPSITGHSPVFLQDPSVHLYGVSYTHPTSIFSGVFSNILAEAVLLPDLPRYAYLWSSLIQSLAC